MSIALLMLGAANSGGAAPLPPSFLGTQVDTTLVQNNDYTITVPASGHIILCIYAGMGGGRSISDITINSVSMTKRADGLVGTSQEIEIWELTGITAGSQTLQVQHSSGSQLFREVITYYDGNGWVFDAGSDITQTGVDPSDYSQNTTAGQWCLGWSVINDGTYSAGSGVATGLTKDTDAIVSGTRFSASCSGVVAGGTPESLSFNWTGATDETNEGACAALWNAP